MVRYSSMFIGNEIQPDKDCKYGISMKEYGIFYFTKLFVKRVEIFAALL